jgi:hypothetical protein
MKIVNYKCRKWVVKNDQIWCQKWVVIKCRKWGVKSVIINWLKSTQKSAKNWCAMGGSKMSKNVTFWVRGVRGGENINFLKFCSFLQKLPPFLTPKIDPIKTSFPTNRLYFSQKWTFMGGPGGGPLGPKNVDTTI